MNWKALGLTVVATATLTACANDVNETGQGLNNEVEQTRFNNTTDYPSYTGNSRYPYGDTTNVRYGADINDRRIGDNTANDHRRPFGDLENNNDQNARFGNNVDTYQDDNQTNRLGTNNDGMNNNTRGINNGTNNHEINNNARLNTNGNNRYEIADEAADRIADQINEIDDAHVLTTNNNAYVAAEINANGNGDVSDEVEQQITRIVKSVDNDIDNVYVSTNPDFVDLTNNYVTDFDNGRPVEGFFDQFGEMIDRIFPDMQ